MTDPGREVQLVAGDTTYTLYAGNRALRLMEREAGQPLGELIDRFNRGDASLNTVALWALLQRHHPNLTVDECDDVIDAAGYGTVAEVLREAIGRAFPDASETDDEPSGKAPRGTGTKSSPARSRPASPSSSSGR